MPADKPLLLLVCTGNICRSAAAELLLRQAVGTESAFSITSAGTQAVPGRPVDPKFAALLDRRGIETDGFRSTFLDGATLQRAGLILTAATSHRAALVQLDPRILHRTFTLKQFARYAPTILERPAPDNPAERVPWIMASVARARAETARHGSDSIADPIGMSARVYQAAFDAVSAAVDQITPLFTMVPTANLAPASANTTK